MPTFDGASISLLRNSLIILLGCVHVCVRVYLPLSLSSPVMIGERRAPVAAELQSD